MTLTIREGGFYKTRDGRKVGPMARCNPSSPWAWKGRYEDGDRSCWFQTGNYTRSTEDGRDLVAEWPDDPPSPVRTVTRKEIVPETYGAVDVGITMSGPHARLTTGDGSSAGPFVVVRLNESLLNAAELRAAAKVFTDLADALEDGESA